MPHRWPERFFRNTQFANDAVVAIEIHKMRISVLYLIRSRLKNYIRNWCFILWSFSANQIRFWLSCVQVFVCDVQPPKSMCDSGSKCERVEVCGCSEFFATNHFSLTWYRIRDLYLTEGTTIMTLICDQLGIITDNAPFGRNDAIHRLDGWRRRQSNRIDIVSG